jgi:hypothetical protein
VSATGRSAYGHRFACFLLLSPSQVRLTQTGGYCLLPPATDSPSGTVLLAKYEPVTIKEEQGDE